MEVSLIIATYGRFTEVDELLYSLVHQDCDKSIFEVIIVDQNDSIDLSPLIEKYKHSLQINYIKSSEKGLALSKNKGIRAAKAPIISFPDDDCKFYPNTVQKAIDLFKEYSDVDLIFGRLYDRKSQKNIMRNWPSKVVRFNKLNFHKNYSAVTYFSKLKNHFFDERFGIGTKYGSGEELNYVMQSLNQGYKSVYHPDLEMWHPELNVNSMNLEKVKKYALGYGKVFGENRDLSYLIIFIGSLCFQIVEMGIGIATFNKELIVKRYWGFRNRLKGFFDNSKE